MDSQHYFRPALFRAWLINAKKSAFVRIMMLLNQVIQMIYMLACITAQINQRSIIVAKSHKYFLDLEIFATWPKYIQFTEFFKNTYLWENINITLCAKNCINHQILLSIFAQISSFWWSLLRKVPGKHQHIMGFRDKMKRNAFL